MQGDPPGIRCKTDGKIHPEPFLIRFLKIVAYLWVTPWEMGRAFALAPSISGFDRNASDSKKTA